MSNIEFPNSVGLLLSLSLEKERDFLGYLNLKP
jgi:hypothetical protein